MNHFKREKMILEQQNHINQKLRREIKARGEDIINLSKDKVYINRLLLYSNLPLQLAPAECGMRTGNGMRIPDGHHLQNLAKLAGLSVFEFQKEYSSKGLKKAA